MRINLLLTLLFLTLVSKAQEENGLVNWLTLAEAQEKNKQQPKPFLVDIYTDWCGWCKHMMKTTYSNPNLASYINANFYAVKFNAETKDTIEYNGKKYYPTSAQPKTPHELAIKFLGQSLSYPSTIFVTNNYEYTMLSQGYLDEKKIEPLLVYVLENVYRRCGYEDFADRFTKAFYDTLFPKKAIKTYSWKEALVLQKKKPKKLLVNISTAFCNSCRVQNKTTFVDTSIASYIEKNFYLVNFDAESNDTIVFNSDKFYKQAVSGYPFNTFAFRLTGGQLTLPSLSVLDEQLQVIDVLSVYQHPKHLKPILLYYGGNVYKTKKWPDYFSEYQKKQKT
jgi:thioredoxin-related protein